MPVKVEVPGGEHGFDVVEISLRGDVGPADRWKVFHEGCRGLGSDGFLERLEQAVALPFVVDARRCDGKCRSTPVTVAVDVERRHSGCSTKAWLASASPASTSW